MRWVGALSPHALILLAVALLGFAHIAFLPPFEGFDETAHLSSIQQIADTGTFPRLDRDMLSTDVENYTGPRAYRPGNQDHTYRAFFEGEAARLPDGEPLFYRPGHTANWEAQHPPLYYLALAPLYKSVQGAGWLPLLLTLRAASWMMAFAGFAVGAVATMHALERAGATKESVIIAATWPLLLPQFFPEMARLGNDSLCLFLMGIAWGLLLRFLERADTRTALLLGLTLALGLWTKAFFLAIGGGVALFLAFAAYKQRSRAFFLKSVMAMAVAAIAGCGWYVQGFITHGAMDFMQADKAQNFWSTIPHTFDLLVFLRGLAGVASSFVWSGSWSFAKFDPLFVSPILLLLLMAFVGWARQATKQNAMIIAPLFIVAPVIAGLTAHWLTQMTLPDGGNGTPGWYLHILAGPLSFVLALGWRHAMIFRALAIYAVVFHAACWLLQLSIFSGCTAKSVDNQHLVTGRLSRCV